MINRLLSIHPLIEFVVRFLFMYLGIFKNFSYNRSKVNHSLSFNFDDLFPELLKHGFNRDGILIVHSSYENISSCGLTPNEIIKKFIDFLGDRGTLAMNSSRRLKKNNDDVYIYDTSKSRVISGVLPALFLKFPGVCISKFPINPMIARGRQSREMMEGNLSDYSTSCGELSSWKFCSDNGAWILGMGIDLTHSLTIVHVNEESNKPWPNNDWYDAKKVMVIDNGIFHFHTILDRKELFGKLYFSERTLAKDLLNCGILRVFFLNGVRFELLNSRELANFLKETRSTTYPYFFVPKRLKSKYG